jgi:hypothetical protein
MSCLADLDVLSFLFENSRYLFLFLKFLSAVIPTIEYDYTMEMES